MSQGAQLAYSPSRVMGLFRPLAATVCFCQAPHFWQEAVNKGLNAFSSEQLMFSYVILEGKMNTHI